jgi:ankyrin repeat protein
MLAILNFQLGDNYMKNYTSLLIGSMIFSMPIVSNAATPLVSAAESGKLEVVQSLINGGGNINEIDSDSVWEKTPLIAAASHGHSEVVDFLLTKGADTKIVDAAGASALRKAVQGGHVTVVELLLNAKADPENDTDEYLRSPLVWALISAESENKDNFAKIIALLHKAGAKCKKTIKSPFDDSDMPISKSVSKADPVIQAAYKKACPDL